MTGVTAGSFTNYDDPYAVTGVFVTSEDTINLKAAGGGGMDTENFGFTTDQKNTLMLAFNNSSGSYTYNSGTVASGKMDLWLNGTKMATWDLNQGASAGVGNGVNGLWIQMPSTVTGTMRVDNISIVPEPNAQTLALLGLAALGGALWGRQRRSVRG